MKTELQDWAAQEFDKKNQSTPMKEHKERFAYNCGFHAGFGIAHEKQKAKLLWLLAQLKNAPHDMEKEIKFMEQLIEYHDNLGDGPA